MELALRAQIRSVLDSFEDQLFIYRKGPDGEKEVLHFTDSGPVFTPYKSHDFNIKPTIQIDTEIMRQIVAALVQSDTVGAPRDAEHLLKGRLEATEKHLEDMRRLVFEPTVHGIEVKK